MAGETGAELREFPATPPGSDRYRRTGCATANYRHVSWDFHLKHAGEPVGGKIREREPARRKQQVGAFSGDGG